MLYITNQLAYMYRLLQDKFLIRNCEVSQKNYICNLARIICQHIRTFQLVHFQFNPDWMLSWCSLNNVNQCTADQLNVQYVYMQFNIAIWRGVFPIFKKLWINIYLGLKPLEQLFPRHFLSNCFSTLSLLSPVVPNVIVLSRTYEIIETKYSNVKTPIP